MITILNKYKTFLNVKSNKQNILVMFAIKGITLAISFLYVPLLLHTLETEAYAIWLTLTSIVSWITMFDVGIGNGLRNKLTESLAKNDINEAKSYVSTAYISILTIGLLVIILFLTSFFFLDWTSILNAKGFNSTIINILVLIVGINFILHFIFGLINPILLAIKMPAISSVIGCIGQALSYVIVLILIKVFKVYGIVQLCATITAIPVITLAVSSIILFNTKYKNIRPNPKYFTKNKLQSIFSLGLIFFWLQIVTIVLFQINNLIITHVVGDAAVVEYNICYKYLYLPVTLYTIICIPFWSSTTHHYTLGNLTWIKETNKKLLRVAFIFTLGSILMLILAPYIYELWLGKDYPHIKLSTNLLMMMYAIFMMFYAASGYMINGIGKLRLQTYITTTLAILYIPTAIIGGKLFGLNGIISALVLNSIINSLWSYLQLRKITSGKASGIWVK